MIDNGLYSVYSLVFFTLCVITSMRLSAHIANVEKDHNGFPTGDMPRMKARKYC